MKCALCSKMKVKCLHPDPSDPPIEEGDCLCDECVVNCCTDRIDDLRREIADLEDMRRRVQLG